MLRELLVSPAARPSESDAAASPAGSLCEHTEGLLRQVLRSHGMHTRCTRHAHGMCTACTRHVHGMHTACTWAQDVHGRGMRMACTRHALHVQVLAVHAEFWPCLATPAHRSFADAYFRVRSESSRRCVKRRQPQAAPPPPRKQPSKGEKPKPKGKNEEDR